MRLAWNRSPWPGVIGIGLLIAGQFAWFAWREHPLYGAPFILTGCLLLLWAVKAWPGSSEPLIESSPPDRGNRRGWLLLLGAGIGLSLFVGWRGTQIPSGNVLGLLSLWAGGIAAVLLALLPPQALRQWLRHVGTSLRTEWIEWLFVLVMFGSALGLRLVWLDQYPPLMAEDEGYFALQAANIKAVNNWEQNPFAFDVLQHFHPMLYHTLQAVSIEVLGRTVTAARVPSALFGALALPGLYLAGRRLFDRRIAAIATLFLLTFTPHLHFSRIAMNNVVDAATSIWLVAFLTRALNTGDPVEYGLAGIMLGLAQYGYPSSRLLPFLMIGYLGLFIWRHRSAWKQVRRGAAIGAILFVVTIWPEAYGLLNQGWALVPRLRDIAVWQSPEANDLATTASPLEYWEHQVARTLLGFVQLPELGYFYGSFDPFLGWVAPVFFFIGLVVALRCWKQPRFAMLILSLGSVALFGGILLDNPPQFQRFLITTPILALLVALGIAFTGDVLAWLSRRLTPEQPVPRSIEYWGIAVAFAVGLAGFNLKTYAVDYSLYFGYFDDYRVSLLNEFADLMLPSLAGYKIYYFSARNLNLSTSPILKYKVPQAIGEEYDTPPLADPQSANELLDRFAQYKGKQAVVIAYYFPYRDALLTLISAMPGMTVQAKVDPRFGLLPLVYTWDSSVPTGSNSDH